MWTSSKGVIYKFLLDSLTVIWIIINLFKLTQIVYASMHVTRMCVCVCVCPRASMYLVTQERIIGKLPPMPQHMSIVVELECVSHCYGLVNFFKWLFHVFQNHIQWTQKSKISDALFWVSNQFELEPPSVCYIVVTQVPCSSV